MKAVVHEAFGPPEVLHLVDVEKPAPRATEVQIRVHATTVNRTDTAFRSGDMFVNRLVNGPIRPRRKILGSELAGVVEAVGDRVTRFRVGDRVFGLRPLAFGAHAEYVCVDERGSIATMPENLSFEQAAAVCDGMIFANNYIRRIDFRTAKSILINGATGSIGSAAVQLARYHGAQVTATCKTAAIELVTSLGADHVVDYTEEDFTKLDRTFDVVLDAVGKSTFFRCRRLLKAGGIYYSTELGPYWQNVGLALTTPLLRGKKVGFPIPTDSQEDILFFKKLIEEGDYRPLVDRTYPLAQIVEATRYVETGEKIGNVVITVA
jgi:NADPH:quinone reductase-like Zn-dependent oxidoreductase